MVRPRPATRGPLLAVALVALCSFPFIPAAQVPEGQQPRFRAGVELVTVDVTVVDQDGRLVEGLQAPDFSVTVDGQARTVVSSQFIGHGVVRDRSRAVPVPADVPSAYGGNDDAAGGRLILIVLDLESITRGEGRSVFNTLAGFLDRLSPADRVGVMPLSGGGPKLDFTGDLERVRDALRKAAGRRIDNPLLSMDVNLGIREVFEIQRGDERTIEAVVERECLGRDSRCQTEMPKKIREAARQLGLDYANETRATVANLASIIDALGEYEGAKTLVLLSEGIVQEFSLLGEFTRVDLGAKAAAARVAIYGLQIEPPIIAAATSRPSPTAADDAAMRAQGLDMVVGLTRGARFGVVGTGAGVFDRLMSELSGYYLLSFEPLPSDRDAKAHRIAVSVDRPDVVVRARQKFTLAASAAPPTTSRERLGRLLRTPLLAAELPLRIMAFASKGDGQTIKLVIGAEIDREESAPGEIAVGYELKDAKGDIVSDSFDEKTVRPADARQPSPLAYFTGVAVKPGLYTLKMAAIRCGRGGLPCEPGDSREGSAELRINARLAAAGPLQVSELIIGGSAGGSFFPRAVTTVGDNVVAYLELYDSKGDAAWDEMTVDIEIGRVGEAPLVTGQGAAQATNDPRRRTVFATLDTWTLQPDTYVCRAIVKQGGRRLGDTVRVLRVVPGE